MILCIADLLTREELDEVCAHARRGRFEAGARTAGWHARTVKKNEQLSGRDGGARKAAQQVMDALKRNVLFQAAARPRRIAPILFNRYAPGMTYGTHVDDAIMGGDDPMRTDVSLTLFLSAPAAYEGGELVIETTGGEQSYKLPAGSAVVYPATTLHRVEPVRSGERLAAVTWVQSLVRDPGHREILFDLDTARREMFEARGKTPAFDLVSKAHANLLRLWAEP